MSAPNVPDEPSAVATELLRKVERREARVCVIGLGYVGLPTAVALAKVGFHVTGADVNARKVAAIESGLSPLRELGLEADLAEAVRARRLDATTDVAAACAAADVVLIIVPTPITKDKQPDLSFVRSAAESAAQGARKGQLVVLESTTYPGTTEEIVVPALERAGLHVGRDVGVAYCPERYNPGDPEHTLANVHRVVGATGDAWGDVAAALYGSLNGGRIVRVRDVKTAEAAKVIENIQRDLNIALVNELALIFERIGVDVKEVLDAASTKWNFVRYAPGPGVGGHCLPVDPYYLTSLAERLGYHPRVILAGRAVNDAMPRHVVELLAEALNGARKPIHGTRVAVLGLAYKADTADAREAPSEHIVAELRRRGAVVRLCDPMMTDEDVRAHFGAPNLALKDALSEAEGVVIVTDHHEFRALALGDLARLVAPGCALVDARNLYAPDAVARAGLVYRGIGRRTPP